MLAAGLWTAAAPLPARAEPRAERQPQAAAEARELRPRLVRLIVISGSLVNDARELRQENDEKSARRVAEDGASGGGREQGEDEVVATSGAAPRSIEEAERAPPRAAGGSASRER